MTEVRLYRAAGEWRQALGRNPSRMELEVAKELQRTGVRFKMQTPITVTTADIEIPLPNGRNLLVFIDGPPHRTRRDRDAEVRTLLSKRGNEILELAYKSYSRKHRDEMVDAIVTYLATTPYQPPTSLG